MRSFKGLRILRGVPDRTVRAGYSPSGLARDLSEPSGFAENFSDFILHHRRSLVAFLLHK
jgi:hypothetical protein